MIARDGHLEPGAVVTTIARAAARVLLDTSPFINFAEAGALLPLAGYLRERAAIALDVDSELRRLSAGRFPALRTLDLLGWPSGEPLALPPDLLADASSLRRLHSRPGAYPSENRGEIATALLAGRIADCVVVMDDDLGKRLCRTRGVARLSSAQLAAETVAAGGIDKDLGFAAFDVATPVGVGREDFERAVARVRATLT